MSEEKYTREEMLKYVPEEHVDLHFAKKKLKGCPFCGSEPKTYVAVGGFVAGCEKDDCLRFTVLHRDLDELVKRWNRRDG